VTHGLIKVQNLGEKVKDSDAAKKKKGRKQKD
jgi:hypothetical protein